MITVDLWKGAGIACPAFKQIPVQLLPMPRATPVSLPPSSTSQDEPTLLPPVSEIINSQILSPSNTLPPLRNLDQLEHVYLPNQVIVLQLQH